MGGSLLEQALKNHVGTARERLGRNACSSLLIVEVQSVKNGVKGLLCDSSYTGKPFTQGAREILDDYVMVQIAKRSERHTFNVIPKRWVVERSFAWLDKSRRLWKNGERWPNTGLQLIHLVFLALMLGRL